MKKKTFLKSAVLLIICNLIGKVIGAVYRIPLANILGGEGMGQYQLTFPLYCLILTVSTSGIPVAISKLVAEYNIQKRFNDAKKLLIISTLILTAFSIFGAVLVVLLAKFISEIQGNPQTYICYYGIAPAIVFVGLISAFRGYFQGNLIMFPTAISNLIEQVSKVAVGLVLAKKLSVFGTEFAVLGALIGISVSEFFACIFLLVCNIFHSRKKKISSTLGSNSYKLLTKQLFSISVPITIGGLITPITSIVDSMLVVNILMFIGFSSSMATTMLGLQSGIVEPLINLPVVVALSISTVLLPNLSSLKVENKTEKIKEMIEKAFQITLSISIACAICYVIFDYQILSFLFGRSLTQSEILLSQKLLLLGSFNVIFLSLVQVSAGILQGLGETKYPVKTLFLGCVIKVALNFVLLSIPTINIVGAVISASICYLVVFILNYRKIRILTGISIKNAYFYISIQACFVCFFAYFTNLLCLMLVGETMSMFIAGGLALIVFFVSYHSFFVGETDSGDFEEQNKLT